MAKKSNSVRVTLFAALDKLSQVSEKIKDFPAVVVDQSNFHISDIIKRNLAGEQVMGNTNLQYDFESVDAADYDRVNPFADMGFDLDDVIRLANENGQRVTDLQNRQGELKQQLDKALSEEAAKNATPQPSPAPVPAPSPEGA